MKKHWDILVVGSVNRDYQALGKHLPKPGESALGHSFQIGPGGKGANQAVAAAKLGARVAFIGCVGRDEGGRLAKASFRHAGVNYQFLTEDPWHSTGAALIMVDEAGEKQIQAVGGANCFLTLRDLHHARSLFEKCSVLLIQLEIPIKIVMESIRMARKAGASVVLDPAPPIPLPKQIYPMLDVIRPNANEAEALLGVRITDRKSARDAGKRFIDLGVRAAALQAGEAGDLMVWDAGEQWLPRLPVQVVDATGAGDAFAAGLAVGLAEGMNLGEAGLLANATAALATTKVGAQAGMPTRREVEAFLNTHGHAKKAKRRTR